MKYKSPLSTNKVTGIYGILLLGFVTLCLLIFKYFEGYNLNVEAILAPFAVINLLIYGDKLLVFIFLSPISVILKRIQKKEDLSLKNN